MKLSPIAFLAAVATTASARHFPEHSAARPSTGQWELLSDAPPTSFPAESPLLFRVYLEIPKASSDALATALADVSVPSSERYGRYWSMAEVDALTRPGEENVDKVVAWASSVDGCKVSAVHQQGGHVEVRCTETRAAEELFGCRLAMYRNAAVASRASQLGTSAAMGPVVRALGGLYSVPDSLKGVVSFVSGLNRFERLRKHEIETVVRSKAAASRGSSNAASGLGGGLAVTPKVLRNRYNISSLTSSSGNSSASITALIGQHANYADLEEFYLLFSSSNVGRKLTKVIGPNDQSSAGIEANLDVQTVGGMTDKGIDMWFWSIAKDAPNNEPFAEWVKEISTTPVVPLIHTTSYGGDESSETASYLLRMDQEFQKLGLRGITLLFAAGDSGIGCGSDGAAAPDWPASSPSVTAVGGTKFDELFEQGGEVVNGLSGGGFSNVYPRPAWQEAAVSGYLTKMADKLPKASFNHTGRGYPDIAALSSGFIVVEHKFPTPGVAGTSCASPTVAAVLAYVNDARIKSGKPALGFLNPLLYSTFTGTEAVFDVTSGKQNACPLHSGFQPTQGWDPASGVGTPNYPGIIAQLEKI